MKNYNHSINYGGKKFFTANVLDKYNKGHGDYDMTVIFVERDDELPPEIVDYYYGEPNMRITVEYIEKYVNSQPSDVVSDNTESNPIRELRELKDFKKWYDHLIDADATDEEIDELYRGKIYIKVAGREIGLAFDAENYNNISTVLNRAIEEF